MDPEKGRGQASGESSGAWPVNIRETRAQSTWTPQDIREDATPSQQWWSAPLPVNYLTASTVRARTAGQAEEAAIALATGRSLSVEEAVELLFRLPDDPRESDIESELADSENEVVPALAPVEESDSDDNALDQPSTSTGKRKAIIVRQEEAPKKTKDAREVLSQSNRITLTAEMLPRKEPLCGLQLFRF
ncbi:hypothetical protein MRX96_002620 [Rhipicephalus microplus]